MKAKKLEKLFFEYMKEKDISDLPADFQTATIYASDEFHINPLQKTLYIQGLGVIGVDIGDIKTIDWIAFAPDNEDSKITLGEGSPYQDIYQELLPSWNETIIAIPHITHHKYRQK